MSKLGAIPQLIAASDISPLDSGATDAVNWTGPYDDEKLGLYRAAKYYHYPGWSKGNATAHTLINLAKWRSLPTHYQETLRDASAWVVSRYDSENPQTLESLNCGRGTVAAVPAGISGRCLQGHKRGLCRTLAKQ